MEQNEDSSGAPPPSAARTNVVEAAVAVLTLAVGIVVMVASRRLGAGWTSDGPGSGYFPFYIGLIVAVSSTAILVQALVGKHRNTGSFVDTQQLKRVMSVLLPAVAYVLLVRFLGLYVASTIYIALFMVILGHYRWTRAIAAAVIINAVLYLMFEVWFKVPLYPGTLEPLRLLLSGR